MQGGIVHPANKFDENNGPGANNLYAYNLKIKLIQSRMKTMSDWWNTI